MKKNSLSVITPALNEEKTLEKVVLKTGEFLKKINLDYELIIIDDGSTDKTGKMADFLAEKDPAIRAVHNPQNMGFGYTVRKGIEIAEKEWATIITADDEVEIDDMRLFLPHTEKADIIIGFIVNKETRNKMRRFLSSCFRFTIKILFGINLPGINGMPFYRVSKVRNIPMKSNDFSIQAEILVKGLNRGLRIDKFGYRIKPRLNGESKAIKFKQIWQSFKSTMKLWWGIKRGN